MSGSFLSRGEAFVLELAEAKPIFTAVTAGLLSQYVFQMGMAEALQFGSVVAVGTSLGDVIMDQFTSTSANIEKYLSPADKIIDPPSLIAAAVGCGILFYMVDTQTEYIGKGLAVAVVAAGVSPKLSSMLAQALSKNKAPNAHTGEVSRQ